ncbi:MAG: HPr-rel-A system PqqD family peptide chaperone [Novosphingobium sp.]|nr:HPr-rel-A system PqqD family peptide chaperone [Novosphingobium sp.]
MTAIVLNSKAFSSVEIDEEVVVMNNATGDTFSIVGTARAIWQLIDGARSRDAIVAALAAEYQAPEERIAGEVDAFLAELAGAGLLARG